jgi:hypothetical protein
VVAKKPSSRVQALPNQLAGSRFPLPVGSITTFVKEPQMVDFREFNRFVLYGSQH